MADTGSRIAAVPLSLVQAELSKLGNLGRAIAGAQTIVDALASAEQVGRELDAANAAKRAALDASLDDYAASTKAAAHGEADAIVRAAQAQGDDLVAAATKRVADIDATITAKQAEADALDRHIADLRAKISAALG